MYSYYFIQFGVSILLGILILENDCSKINKSSKNIAHPTLYFGSTDIVLLREKARTTHKNIANVIRNAVSTILEKPEFYLPSTNYKVFGSKWNEIYGNNLALLGFYCLLYPEDKITYRYTIEFMDRMVKLQTWQVIASPTDEVPIAHSLTGFASAYDFLYPLMDDYQKNLYLERIQNVTYQMCDASKKRWWGRVYLQNHVATNMLAIITAGLVLEIHDPQVSECLINTVDQIEHSMFLLNFIVDGSLDEGVAYGSYTSRSLSQYVFLGLRHFNIDHTRDLWWKEHFWFYYYTILPGFKLTIGIADSNKNWFYGPESQLVFLDNFILRNGHGNWLAQNIRQARSYRQPWVTLHTEFLWYDATLKPRPPNNSGNPTLHNFVDWGVVTYSSINPHSIDDTYLSLKSGRVSGRGMQYLLKNDIFSSWIDGWHSFNPGHEHPDQNSFIFAPNGNLFISDGLYGIKYTHLNNVLTFSPSVTSHCNQPWEGQLGECSKWLSFSNTDVISSGGDIICANMQNDIVFTSAEAVGAYNKSLKLKSVYRSLTLLNKHLLLVVDHISLHPQSHLLYSSAFFHNILTNFLHDQLNSSIFGAKVQINNEDYRMFWADDKGRSVKPIIAVEENPSIHQDFPTTYVNVTYKLSGPVTRMIYILASPNVEIIQFGALESTNEYITVSVETAKDIFEVKIVTEHDNPLLRQQILGFGGHSLVKINGNKCIKFGLNVNNSLNNDVIIKNFKNTFFFEIYYLVVLIIVLVLLFLYIFKKPLFNRKFQTIVFFLVLLIILYIKNFLTINSDKDICDNYISDSHFPIPVITSLPGSGSEVLSQLFWNNPDFLFLQIPSDINKPLKNLEVNISLFMDICHWNSDDLSKTPFLKDWLHSFIKYPGKNFIFNKDIFEIEQRTSTKTFNRMKKKRYINRHKMKKILQQLKKKDKSNFDSNYFNYTVLNGEDTNYRFINSKELYDHWLIYPKKQAAFHLVSGIWNIKLPWLHELFGSPVRILNVIRDPRAWISSILFGNPSVFDKLQLFGNYKTMWSENTFPCDSFGSYAKSYDKLLKNIISRNTSHTFLAYLWLVNTNSFLESSSSLSVRNLKILKFEDIILYPKKISHEIFSFLGLPLHPIAEHQFLQSVQSNFFLLPYEGTVSTKMVDSWKDDLTSLQIKDIEDICGLTMKNVGYKLINEIS